HRALARVECQASHASSICKQGLVPLFLCAALIAMAHVLSLGGRRVPGFVPGRAARDADHRTFQHTMWLPNGYTRATGPIRWKPLLGNDEGAHCTRAGLWNTATPRLSPGPHRSRATNSPIRSVGRGFV